MPGCILVMCGLPGSGKTTLVSQVVPTAVTGHLSCAVVDYDKLMPPEVERSLIDKGSQDQDGKLWKHYREEIVTCTDKLLNLVNPSENPSENKEEIPVCEKEAVSKREAVSQREALNKKEAMGQREAVDSERLWENFSKTVDVTGVNATNQDILVIVDDNMYYRSMRYDYYQLARKYTYGFCEVYVKCPLTAALARNRERTEGKVKDDVIVAMETKMEIPDSCNCNWEKYSLVVTSEVENKCSKIFSLVRRAMQDPVTAPADDSEDRQESRRVCSSNTVHQADQIVRKLLTQQLKTAKGEGKTKEEMKMLSNRLLDVKTSILNDMRSGVITFDTDASDASKDETSELFRFVQKIFDSRTTDVT